MKGSSQWDTHKHTLLFIVWSNYRMRSLLHLSKGVINDLLLTAHTRLGLGEDMSKQRLAERICIIVSGLLMTGFALYSVAWLALYELSRMLYPDSPPSFWSLTDVLSKLELSRFPLIPLFILGMLSVIILIGFLSFAQRIIEPIFKLLTIWWNTHSRKAAIKSTNLDTTA